MIDCFAMNRINVLLTIALAAAVLIALSGQTKQPQSIESMGRYHLFSGETDRAGFDGTDKVILRIDSQTGDVDQWIVGARKDGTIVDMWARTGEIHPKPTK
jgi:hypothetical protein